MAKICVLLIAQVDCIDVIFVLEAQVIKSMSQVLDICFRLSLNVIYLNP